MVQCPKQHDDQKDNQQGPDEPTINAHARFTFLGRPMITADDCWADYRTPADLTHGRPCLFLDRDGVLIEDTGYPHRPEEVVIIPEAIAAVAAAQRAGFVAGIVSNQSGIARGLFDWPAFEAVQAVIDGAFRRSGTKLDFVLACPHHPEAGLRQLRVAHDWRKPRPGMLVAAHQTLGLDMTRSIMLGDRASDMEAAAGAGVAHRLILAGPQDDSVSLDARRVSRSSLGTVAESLVTTLAGARYAGR